MAMRIVHDCDMHLQREEYVDGNTIPPITLPNGQQVVLDLCDECVKSIPYADLLDLATFEGREVEPKTKKTRVESSEQFQCDFCSRTFNTAQGKSMHQRRTHPEMLDPVERTEPTEVIGGDISCQYCERTFQTRSGLSSHVHARHRDEEATA